MMVEKKRCKHCNEELDEHYGKEKNFCSAKCNNDNFTFRKKLLFSVDDELVRQKLQEQFQNGVPTCILTSLVRNFKRESKMSGKHDENGSPNHVVCFYKNLIANVDVFFAEKSTFMVKQQLVA